MPVELAVAYVSLVPSAKGITSAISKELSGPTSKIAAEAGSKASASFSEKFASGLSKAGQGISKAGDKLSLAVTAPLALLAVKATDAASDLNESVNATNVVFGKSGQVIDQWAAKSATSFGLSARAFREAVTPMGASLQNLGLAQADAADWSVKLAGRASDMASVFNTNVSDALEAINAGLRGEADPLERYGVGLSEAAVQGEAMRLGLGKMTADLGKVEAAQLKVERAQRTAAEAARKHGASSLEAREANNRLAAAQANLEKATAGGTAELSAQDKAQARLSLIMRQTEKISGDFANTSNQAANAQRIEAARAEDAAAAFGQQLLPIKQKLIRVAGQLLDGFNNLSEGQKDLIVKAGLVAAALGPVLSVTGRLTRAFSGAVKAGGAVAKFSSGVIKGMRGVSTAADGASTSVARSFGRMVGNAIRATATIVKQIAIQVARWVWMGIQALLNAAKVALAWVISLGPITLVVAAVAAAAILIIKHWDKIKAFVTAAVGAVVNFVKAHWPILLAILTGPIGLATLAIIRNWDKIKAAASAVVNWVVGRFLQIVQFFAGLPGRILAAVGNVARLLASKGHDIVNGLINGVKEKATELANWLRGLGSKILGWVGDLGRLLYKAGRSVIRGFVDGLKSMFGEVKDSLGDLTGKLASFKGPVVVDRRILFGSGQLVMEGFMRGIDSQLGPLRDQLGGITGSLSADVGVRNTTVMPIPAGLPGAAPIVNLYPQGSVLAERDVERIVQAGIDRGRIHMRGTS